MNGSVNLRQKEAQVPVFLYHRIVARPQDRASVYDIDGKEFERQMSYLRQTGIQVIPLDKLVTFSQNGGKHPERAVCLTFDDGDQSHYQNALPILKESHFSATFFLTVGAIGSPGYLCWEEVLAMQGEGMSIQSHSMTHPFLTDLGREDKIYELMESKVRLEEKLNRKVFWFSLPGGRGDEETFVLAGETGYTGICTSRIGMKVRNNGLVTVDRIAIKADLRFKRFCAIARGEKKELRHLRTRQLFLDVCKRAMGDTLYCRLRDGLLSEDSRYRPSTGTATGRMER